MRAFPGFFVFSVHVFWKVIPPSGPSIFSHAWMRCPPTSPKPSAGVHQHIDRCLPCCRQQCGELIIDWWYAMLLFLLLMMMMFWRGGVLIHDSHLSIPTEDSSIRRAIFSIIIAMCSFHRCNFLLCLTWKHITWSRCQLFFSSPHIMARPYLISAPVPDWTTLQYHCPTGPLPDHAAVQSKCISARLFRSRTVNHHLSYVSWTHITVLKNHF